MAALEGNPVPPIPQEDVQSLRERLCELLGCAVDTLPGLSPSLIEAYCRLSKDPDVILAQWLRQGAPLGIKQPIVNTGIFPPVPAPKVDPKDVAAIATDPAGWSNYISAVADPEVCRDVLNTMVDKGWALKFSSWNAVLSALQSTMATLNPELPIRLKYIHKHYFGSVGFN